MTLHAVQGLFAVLLPLMLLDACKQILEKLVITVLAKCVSIGYTFLMKDSGLRIRVEREFREKFLEICRQQDRPAAQVIREFMRTYIEAHTNENNRKTKKKTQ